MGCITGVGNANLLQVVFVLHFFQVARLFYVLQLPIQLGYDKNIHYTYHCAIKDIICIIHVVLYHSVQVARHVYVLTKPFSKDT